LWESHQPTYTRSRGGDVGSWLTLQNRKALQWLITILKATSSCRRGGDFCLSLGVIFGSVSLFRNAGKPPLSTYLLHSFPRYTTRTSQRQISTLSLKQPKQGPNNTCHAIRQYIRT
jgi:hypothetical protein